MTGFCGVAIDLFDNINFQGSFRTLIAPLADFRNIDFNDRASSAIVRPLPGSQPGDAVRLWSDINFQGTPLDMGPGQYPDFRAFNFNDLASSMQCIRVSPTTTPTTTPTTPPGVIAEDRQIETLSFNLQLIPPAGSTIIAVQENRILNLQAVGRFTGAITVQVNGSFLDEIVVLLRNNATGATSTGIGRVTIPFTKNITFPQLAGLNQANLRIVVTARNPVSNFSFANNILSKTVRFELITQVIRLLTSSALEEDDLSRTVIEPDLNILDTYIVMIE